MSVHSPRSTRGGRSRRARRGVLALSLAAVMMVSSLEGVAEARPSAAASGAEPLEPHAAGKLIVGFREGTDVFSQARAFTRRDVSRGRRLSPVGARTEVVTLPPGMSVEAAMASFKSDPAVRFAEPDYLVQKVATSNDTLYNSLWGMHGDASSPANQFGSGAAEAWAAGFTGSSSVVVGVIDEGIQVTHPDLAANIWTNTAEAGGVSGVDDDGNGYVDDVNGWDFFHGDSSVYDAGQDAHGTHVAGTIGGVGGNGLGVAGVNWSVKMVSAKFLGPGGGSITDAVAALNYLIDLKVNRGVNLVAVNNSWGGGGFSTAMADAINRAGDAGILFIAAAGDSARDNDASPTYPANYDCSRGGTRWDCVVAVAAIDSGGNLASFSQWGANTVDLGAPGVNITSTLPTNTYGAYNGTSMAAPHVTGAAALCASMGLGVTGEGIRYALTASTSPTASLAGKTATGGRLDIGAMTAICAPLAGPVSGSVTGLTATATSFSGILLTWVDGVTNETRFEIERAAADCSTFIRVGEVPMGATSFRVSGLTASTGYCFRVRGANGTGANVTTTAWSATASATTLPPPPPPPPPLPYRCTAVTYTPIDMSSYTAYTMADDSAVTVTMPFAFSLYGAPTTALTISSNGFVRLGSGVATSFSNVAIPSTLDPNNMIAPWWDDLVPSAGGVRISSVGTAPNRQFVVMWLDAVPLGQTSGVTFQVILREATQDVVMQYLDTFAGSATHNGGASATIGIENAAGTAGTQVSFNSASRTDASGLLCTNVPPPLSIATVSLPVGSTGVPYSQNLAASGGTSPYVWTAVNPAALPAGLTLSTAGVLSGIPTVAGTSTFGVRVDDATGGVSTKQFTVSVAAPVTITPATLPGGTANMAYPSTTIAAAGGTGAYSFTRTLGTLPAGLTLSAAGVIAGTPTAAGTSTFTVQAQDGAGRTGSQQFSITIAPGVSITTATLPNGTVGVAHASTQLAATGGTAPYTWTVATGALPAGLTLSAGGLLSGRPTTAGASTFALRVTDTRGLTAMRSYSVTIAPGALPGAFNKTSPAAFITNRVRNGLVLSWGVSTGAVSYEYCIDTTNNSACDGTWVSVGAARTATLNALFSRTVYYWQVRSVNGSGSRLANNGTWWNFTTVV